jgi:hypothetical protein
MKLQPWWFVRLADVKRWGVVAVHKQESVAEHSYQVAGIVFWIYQRFESELQDLVKRNELLEWALLHDLAEIYTGDFPTPMKAKIGGLLNHTIAEFNNTPDNDLILGIVKLADIAQAIVWLTQHGVNRHANSVVLLLRQEYGEKINMLTSHFIDLEPIWMRLSSLPDDLLQEREE